MLYPVVPQISNVLMPDAAILVIMVVRSTRSNVLVKSLNAIATKVFYFLWKINNSRHSVFTDFISVILYDMFEEVSLCPVWDDTFEGTGWRSNWHLGVSFLELQWRVSVTRALVWLNRGIDMGVEVKLTHVQILSQVRK